MTRSDRHPKEEKETTPSDTLSARREFISFHFLPVAASTWCTVLERRKNVCRAFGSQQGERYAKVVVVVGGGHSDRWEREKPPPESPCIGIPGVLWYLFLNKKKMHFFILEWPFLLGREIKRPFLVIVLTTQIKSTAPLFFVVVVVVVMLDGWGDFGSFPQRCQKSSPGHTGVRRISCRVGTCLWGLNPLVCHYLSLSVCVGFSA